MRHKLISVFLSLLILAAGAALGYWAWKNKPVEPGVANAAKAEKVPNVAVKVLKQSHVQDMLALTGSLEPWEEVVLSAEVPGPIEWQGVEEGQSVEKGQELFRIDTTSLRAKRDELQAQMALAEQEYDRLARLEQAGISAKQDLDRATAQRAVAEAGLRSIDIQLAKSVVRAPFSGVVDRVLKERNEYVDPGMAMVRMVQLDKVKVVVGIPERDVAHFELGDTVTVALDALAGEAFTGTIHQMAPTAEPGTHTFPTEIALENAAGKLRPGMIARAAFVRASYPDSIEVPVFALITLDDRRYVVVEENSVVHQRPVEVGVFLGETVQVTQGLEAGERLVVRGQRELRDGASVVVQEVLE